MKGSKGLVLKLWQLAVIIFINILIIGIVMSTSANALSKVGSTGRRSEKFRRGLKNGDILISTVDGIYGTKNQKMPSFTFKKKERVDGRRRVRKENLGRHGYKQQFVIFFLFILIFKRP